MYHMLVGQSRENNTQICHKTMKCLLDMMIPYIFSNEYHKCKKNSKGSKLYYYRQFLFDKQIRGHPRQTVHLRGPIFIVNLSHIKLSISTKSMVLEPTEPSKQTGSPQILIKVQRAFEEESFWREMHPSKCARSLPFLWLTESDGWRSINRANTKLAFSPTPTALDPSLVRHSQNRDPKQCTPTAYP